MRKDVNKAKFILYCITFVVHLVYSIGIFVFYAKTDDLDNVHDPFLMLALVAIFALVLNFPSSDKDDD